MRYFDIKLAPDEVGKDNWSRLTTAELEEHVAKGRPVLELRAVPWDKYFHRELLRGIGYVKLVDVMGDDLEPLRSARLSTGNETGVNATADDRLRTRLWRDRHTSPFETNIAVFELQAPMFVIRQLDRHRTVAISEMKHEVVEDYDDFRRYTSRNEFSGRYSQMPDLYYVPPLTRIRAKGTLNKQGSGDMLSPHEREQAHLAIEAATAAARATYNKLLEAGVASELARVVLPQNQVTKIRLQASLLNWFRMLELRMAPDVQDETQAYAWTISNCLQALWPRCFQVFEEHTLGAVTFSETEVHELKLLLQVHAENVPSEWERVHRRLEERLRSKDWAL